MEDLETTESVEDGICDPFDGDSGDGGNGGDVDETQEQKANATDDKSAAPSGEDGENTEKLEDTNGDDSKKKETGSGEKAEELFPLPVEIFGENKQFSMGQAVKALQDSALLPLMARDLTAAKQNPAIAFVENGAKAAGMEVSDFIAQQKSAMGMAELAAQYGDISEIPDSVLQLHTKNVELEAEKIKGEMAAAAEQAKINEFELFAMQHPKVTQLPQEVLKMVSDGKALEDAWNVSENKRLSSENAALKEQLAIKEKNENNKNKQLPKGQSSHIAKEKSNVWLDAFVV